MKGGLVKHKQFLPTCAYIILKIPHQCYKCKIPRLLGFIPTGNRDFKYLLVCLRSFYLLWNPFILTSSKPEHHGLRFEVCASSPHSYRTSKPYGWVGASTDSSILLLVNPKNPHSLSKWRWRRVKINVEKLINTFTEFLDAQECWHFHPNSFGSVGCPQMHLLFPISALVLVLSLRSWVPPQSWVLPWSRDWAGA